MCIRDRFGSIVQKGKFSAWIPAEVSALNNVDFPTFGKPTIPHLKDIIWNEECLELYPSCH